MPSRATLQPGQSPRPRTLNDVLARLTPSSAANLLGPDGDRQLARAGRIDIDLDEQVTLTDDWLQVTFPAARSGDTPVIVTVEKEDGHRKLLAIRCTEPGEAGAPYKAAVLALILEEKSLLGLATAPNTNLPWELMPESQLEDRAVAERVARAREESMKIQSADRGTPWADYLVTNSTSGKTWRVALRGMERGESYCSCPDFRKNRLGTCKHVIKVIEWARKRFDRAALSRRWLPRQFAVYARYDGDFRLALLIPPRVPAAVEKLATAWRERTAASGPELLRLIDAVRQLELAGIAVTLYPDAAEFIDQTLHRHRMNSLVETIRRDPAQHPLRHSLLRVPLLAYQLDGIAFAAGAGRAVLADEMGLGKTIQGVGVAELLAREVGIRRVLVVCPASLKSQWQIEIRRFCDRSAHLVAGPLAERAAQYARDEAFFTLCNYEQELRDHRVIERVKWDLIILDEGQRIKNWEARTSRVIKSLRSPFALVLTGTPLENRLDELFSVVEFIDDRHLGPAYRFIQRHRVASETGRVSGYRNLDALREQLRPVLLRRTRTSVALDLPPRTNEIIRVVPTQAQLDIHGSQMMAVQAIVRKRFLTEMDLLRLQKLLQAARMCADSTYLVDRKAPGDSSKLEALRELLGNLAQEPERKMILFSEWTTMLDLIEPLLRDVGLGFVRLDGGVAQKKRQTLVHRFQHDPLCRAFLTTNAGSTGLNLQAADTVINIDLPWNPAVLEQRVARAYRMGQQRPVHVYLLITEQTLEENLLATLSAKHELAAAVLDPDSTLTEVSLASGMEELKRRLELLLGAKPEAVPDVVTQEKAQREVALLHERRERIAEASGQMLTAAFTLIGEVLPGTAQPDAHTLRTLKESLTECIETGEDGKTKLTLTLPSAESVDLLVASLAKLVGHVALPRSAAA